MPNQSLCESCRYGNACDGFIAGDRYCVKCDQYQQIRNLDRLRVLSDKAVAELLHDVLMDRLGCSMTKEDILNWLLEPGR